MMGEDWNWYTVHFITEWALKREWRIKYGSIKILCYIKLIRDIKSTFYWSLDSISDHDLQIPNNTKRSFSRYRIDNLNYANKTPKYRLVIDTYVEVTQASFKNWN